MEKISPAPAPEFHPESGIAMFVVMVVIAVLAVLVSQLTVTTKVEERIAISRRQQVEVELSFQAVARIVMNKIYEDWVEDKEAGLEGDDGTGGAGAPAGPGSGTRGGAGGLGGGSGDDDEDAQSGTPSGEFDFRHDDWRHRFTESLNEVEVEIEIVDGESCIDLNHLFWYVTIPDDPQNPGDSLENALPDDDSSTEGTSSLTSTTAGTDPLAGDDPTEQEDLPEFEFPSEERIEKTVIMLAKLVEAVIDTNQLNGYDYYEVPNPDTVADAIVNWVLQRFEDEETRQIWSLQGIEQLDVISYELMHGPALPEDELEELEEEELYADDEFYSGFDEFGAGIYEGFEENEDATGLIPIPEPLGLSDVLTCFSSGRINLNTARREVLIALLVNVSDFEAAWEIANEIDVHLNTYLDAQTDDSSPGTSAPSPGGTSQDAENALSQFGIDSSVLGGSAGSSGAGGDESGLDEEEEQVDFNVFTDFPQVIAVNEEWNSNDILIDDQRIADHLQTDLQPVSTFKSRYFTARLKGVKEKQELEGELVLVRYNDRIQVLSWKSLSK